jgi:hypothetical protein
MSKQTQEEIPEQDPILSPQTICAFADQLFRLAKDIRNLVANSIASPHILSNLTVMKSIISLLRVQGDSTILNSREPIDMTQSVQIALKRGVSQIGCFSSTMTHPDDRNKN